MTYSNYPNNNYLHVHMAAFRRQGLGKFKKEHKVITGKIASRLASLSAYPPTISNAHIYKTQQSVASVAAQPFGMQIVRYTANDLPSVSSSPKKKLTRFTKAKEMIMSSVKRSRHMNEHDPLMHKIMDVMKSNDPRRLASLIYNDGFLTMCLHDKDLLQSFRGLLHTHTMSLPLTQKSDAYIKKIQQFIKLKPEQLSAKLQQANANFYKYGIKRKVNQQTKADLLATSVKTSIAALPVIGSAAATSITVADTVRHINLNRSIPNNHDNDDNDDTSKKPSVVPLNAKQIVPAIATGQTLLSPALITSVAIGSADAILAPISFGAGMFVAAAAGITSAGVKNLGSKKHYFENANQNLSMVARQSVPVSYSSTVIVK
jgi:hypothetical protein